jgi:cyclopropane fatty-acyl-phospholipid synthase-like methyltransferase
MRLAPGATVLDLGCGSGVPITQVLVEGGFNVFGVDASPTLVEKFRERFPGISVECCAVEDSDFFDRTFDAIVAWGLMFLLPAETQLALIGRVARVLRPAGQFLFTSPWQVHTWIDNMTRLPSVSLGRETYERELIANGLVLTGNAVDRGENYYYFCELRER